MDPESSNGKENHGSDAYEVIADQPVKQGPWEELAAGASRELEKWMASRRDRRRERRAGGVGRPRMI
jgi:hypothetical protein